MIVCPFDSVHVVRRSKLLVHITRCKQNLPVNHDFVRCEFNAVHYVKSAKLKQHYEECASIQTHIANIATWDAEPSTYCQPKLIVDQGVQESTEIWEDLSGPAFHPEKLLAEASYMITPANLSRSKRIQFKETERQRLRGRESSSDSSKSNSDSVERLFLHDDYDLEPRKPDTAPKMAGPKIAAKFSSNGQNQNV